MSEQGSNRWSRRDLTRWNRSGLSKLLYADGNAADYMETMRSFWAKAKEFSERWQAQLEPLFDRETLEKEEEDEEWVQNAANRHVIEQYRGDRGDIAWELARVFARSCHVLTQHINAHANEAFLRTATEWEDLRKMVAMLGYQPVGATSATTMLVIDARAKGRVEKGLQVRYRPPDGGKAIIFEALEDLDVNDQFNLFQVEGWDSSKTTLSEVEAPSDSQEQPWPWLENPKAPTIMKDSTLIINEALSDAEAAWMVDKRGGRLRLEHEANKWQDWQLGRVKLMSSPRFRRTPWINGEAVRRTSVPHGLSSDSVVAWRIQGEKNPKDWRFSQIKEADAFGLKLAPHKDKFKEVIFSDQTSAYNYDDQWIAWGDGDIELRRATKLTGSFTVPASSELGKDPEAEKYIGALADFETRHLFGGTPSVDEPELLAFRNSEEPFYQRVLSEPDEAELNDFIKWLFGAVGIASSMPPTPLEIVKIGAMMMTKDARIPSTGQLVFEAFIDLFGNQSGDSVDYSDINANRPALFRFWTKGGKEQVDWNSGLPPGRLPFNEVVGELWFLPKRHVGGGDVPVKITDPEYLTAKNKHDAHWFFFDGKPTGLKEGDWVAAQFAGPAGTPLWRAVKILDMVSPLRFQEKSGDGQEDPSKRYEQPGAFALLLRLPQDIEDTFEKTEMPIPELIELQADYRATDVPDGASFNKHPLSDPVKLAPCPGTELIGRTLLATNDKGDTQVVRVASVSDCEVTLEPQLLDKFKEGNLKLYGNVVRAGHGKRQPPLRTGGGSGPERDNFLILQQREVSTVPDTRLLHGAREDLEVRIAGEQWQQQTRLDDSQAADRHFEVSTTEEGYLKLTFGDGKRGRALPPGTDNVEIRYRVGAGKNGSGLPPHSLEQLVQPHPLVKAVMQPLETVGGNDMELPEQMRQRAPASLLALERAVSLHDFEQLAMQHRSVAHASAFYQIGGAGYRDCVIVFAAATGGQSLSPAMQDDLAAYLQHHAVPTVRVKVEQHESVDIEIDVTIRVDYSSYEADKVAIDVIDAIAEQFSPEHRTIGLPLRLSEVYAVVESVTGIEDSVCSFAKPIGSEQVVTADRHQLAAIEDRAALHCTPFEYVP